MHNVCARKNPVFRTRGLDRILQSKSERFEQDELNGFSVFGKAVVRQGNAMNSPPEQGMIAMSEGEKKALGWALILVPPLAGKGHRNGELRMGNLGNRRPGGLMVKLFKPFLRAGGFNPRKKFLGLKGPGQPRGPHNCVSFGGPPSAVGGGG